MEVTSTGEPGQDPEDYARGLWLRAHLLRVEDQDLSSLRRRVSEIESDYEARAQITWVDVTFTVDDHPCRGKQAALDDDWVTLVDRDSALLVISGQRWTDRTPDLVTIHDVEPYVRGSLQVWEDGFKSAYPGRRP